MTFILEAQNKSRGIKPESSAELIKSRHFLITTILSCSFALLATGLLMFNGPQINHASQPKTQIEEPKETAISNTSKKSNELNLEFDNIEVELDKPSNSGQSKQFVANFIQKVTGHIYTQNPAGRSVFIEGKAYQIGDRYESIEIRDIYDKGISIRMRTPGPDGTDLTISLVDKWLEK